MIGNNIIELEETFSTNRYALELLSNSRISEGTVISVVNQTSGRGSYGNFWESEKGKNLTVSIILYPTFLSFEKQFMLNKVTSLSVYDMLVQINSGQEAVMIKWPNDIYTDNKKFSGILIENTIIGSTFKHSIIGIGININQEIFVSDAPNPTSLKISTGKTYNLKECLSILCSCFNRRYTQLKNFEFKTLDEDYLSALYRMNKSALFIFQKQLITAMIKGVAESGKLLIEKLNGEMIECDFKEVEFVI